MTFMIDSERSSVTTLLSGAARPAVTSSLRRTRASLAFTFAVAGMLFAAWVPHIPEVKDRLGLSAGSLGVALFAPAIGSMLSMSVAGGLTARFGSARTTRALMIFFCLVGWLPGIAHSLPELWAALFVWGIGIGGIDVSMNAQAVTVEKAYRRPVMSGFHAAWSLGSLIGAGIGTAGVALGISITAQQIGLGAVLLIVGLVASTTFLADPVGEPETAPAPKKSRRGPFAVMDVRLLLLGLAALAAMLSEGSVGDWSGVLLRDSLHAATSHIGLAYAAFMATETIGRLAGDRIVHRFGRVRAITILTIIGSVGLAAGMATGTVIGTIIGFALLGIGLAVMVPVAFSAAADGRAQAGPAIAAVSSIAYLGFLVGPTAIGVLAQVTSVPFALWMIPIISAAGGALAITAIRREA